MKKNNDGRYFGWIAYLVSIVLMVVSFYLPPQGTIDPSVLFAAGILIAGYQLIWGHSIKEINIDKSGIHIVTHDKNS